MRKRPAHCSIHLPSQEHISKTRPLESRALQYTLKSSLSKTLSMNLKMLKYSCIFILLVLCSVDISSAANLQDRRHVFRDPYNRNNQIITSRLQSDPRKVQQKPPLDESWLLSAIHNFAGTVQDDPFSFTTKKYPRLTTTAPLKSFDHAALREAPLKVKYNTFSPSAEQFSEFKLRQFARLTTPRSSEVSVPTTNRRKHSTRATTTTTTTTERPAYDEYESESMEKYDNPSESEEASMEQNVDPFVLSKIKGDTFATGERRQPSRISSSTTAKAATTTKRYPSFSYETYGTDDYSSEITPEDLSAGLIKSASSKTNENVDSVTKYYKRPKPTSTTIKSTTTSTKSTTTTTGHSIDYNHGNYEATIKSYKRPKTTSSTPKSTTTTAATTTTAQELGSYIEEPYDSDEYSNESASEGVNKQQNTDADSKKADERIAVPTNHNNKYPKGTSPAPELIMTITEQAEQYDDEDRDTEDHSAETSSEDFSSERKKDATFSGTYQGKAESTKRNKIPDIGTVTNTAPMSSDPATTSEEQVDGDYESDELEEYSSDTDSEDDNIKETTEITGFDITEEANKITTSYQHPGTTPATTTTMTATSSDEYTDITREAVLNIWNFFNGRLVHAGKHKIPVGTRDGEEEPAQLSGSSSLILQLLANNIAFDQHGNFHVVDNAARPSSDTILNYNIPNSSNTSLATSTVANSSSRNPSSTTTPTTTTTPTPSTITTTPSTTTTTTPSTTTTTTPFTTTTTTLSTTRTTTTPFTTTPTTTTTTTPSKTTTSTSAATTKAAVALSLAIVPKPSKPEGPKLMPFSLQKTESTTKTTQWPYPGSSTTLGPPVAEYKAPPVEAFLPDFLLEQRKQSIQQRNAPWSSNNNNATSVSVATVKVPAVVSVPATTQQAITQTQHFSSTVQSSTTTVSSTPQPTSRSPTTIAAPVRLNPLQLRVQHVRPPVPVSTPGSWNTIMTLGISMLPSMALALPLVVPFVGRKRRAADLPALNEMNHIALKAL